MKILTGCDIVSITGKRLSTFGTIWVRKSITSAVNFMKFNYKSSVINETLVSALWCATNIQHTPDFQDSMTKTMKNIAIIFILMT